MDRPIKRDQLRRDYRQFAPLPPDIKIARAATPLPIREIGLRAGFREEEMELYGTDKAKIGQEAFERLEGESDGRLILVTAMTPTPAGEGKTVTSIGLAQALGKKGLRHILCLREPSLGPIFGIKGGAAGGGYAQILPMEEINMHFTGDLHAITTAHNLLAAVLDNHIHFGNGLRLDMESITWRRVMDLCDRQLRNCEIGLGSRFDGFAHRTGFDITAASEIMAILALARDSADLQKRLERIIVGFDESERPVYAKQLEAVGAMMVLLKDAIKPNLVQTLEQTPVLVHCGPFGNIAHGCNSVRATRLALKLADFVVTEAGFAADLGAEKFFNIKCRSGDLRPDAAVLVVSCRAAKRHGGVPMDRLAEENPTAVERGLANAAVHLENLSKFGIPTVVAVNRFQQDRASELDAVFRFWRDQGVAAALSEVAGFGGEGGLELAEKVVAAIEEQGKGVSGFRLLYDEGLTIREKIDIIATRIYRASGVEYEDPANGRIAHLEKLGLDRLPLCMAKTQTSLSDDPKKLGAPSDWRLKVKDLRISNGAGYLVVITGKMTLMPGMPRESVVKKIGIDEDGEVYGLS